MSKIISKVIETVSLGIFLFISAVIANAAPIFLAVIFDILLFIFITIWLISKSKLKNSHSKLTFDTTLTTTFIYFALTILSGYIISFIWSFILKFTIPIPNSMLLLLFFITLIIVVDYLNKKFFKSKNNLKE